MGSTIALGLGKEGIFTRVYYIDVMDLDKIESEISRLITGKIIPINGRFSACSGV